MPKRPTSLDQTQFHRIARALADPQRFAILEMLASTDEVACQAIVKRFDITQATISHHLKELQFAGLIDGRRDGRCFHFKLKRDVLDAYRRALSSKLGSTQAPARQRRPKQA